MSCLSHSFFSMLSKLHTLTISDNEILLHSITFINSLIALLHLNARSKLTFMQKIISYTLCHLIFKIINDAKVFGKMFDVFLT